MKAVTTSIGLAAAAFLSFSMSSSALVLNFNDLPVETRFDERHQPYSDQGVEFYGRLSNLRVVSTDLDSCDRSDGLSGTNHALRNFPGAEMGSDGEDVTVKLSFPAEHVSLCLGTDRDEERDPLTAKILAYRNNGTVFVTQSETTIPPDYLGCGRQLSLTSAGEPFDTFIISYGFFTESELIDRIEIRPSESPEPESPIIDEEPPVVTISNPQENHYTPFDDFSEISRPLCPPMISGYVDEDRALERLTVSWTTGFSGLESVHYDLSNQRAPRYYFGVPVTGMVPGHGNRIIVEAEDIGHNTRATEIAYTCFRGPEPPAAPIPGIDFRGAGLEVTQAIQGWEAIPTRDVSLFETESGELLELRENEVELAAGKDTLVRVYGGVFGVDDPIAGVKCELHGKAGEQDLPGSPLTSDPVTELTPNESFHFHRLDSVRTCNFILPPSWTEAGTKRLVGVINAWNHIPEARYDQVNNTGQYVTFHDTENVCFIFHPITADGDVRQNENPPFITRIEKVTPSYPEWVLDLVATESLLPISQQHISYLEGVPFDTDDYNYDFEVQEQYDEFHYDFEEAVRGTREEGCDFSIHIGTFHGDANVAPIPDGEVYGTVLAQLVQNPALTEDLQIAHEIGHAFGLKHVLGNCRDCSPGATVFPTEPGPHEDYPEYRNHYGNAYFSASIGDRGVKDIHTEDTSFTLVSPWSVGDLMSYCGDKWVSVYSWRKLLATLRIHNATGSVDLPAEMPLASQNVLSVVLGNLSSRIINTADAKDFLKTGRNKSLAKYFLVGGSITPRGKASIRDIRTETREQGSKDDLGDGPYVIRLSNLAGKTLFEKRFNPAIINDSGGGLVFRERLPALIGTAQIQLSGPGIKPVTVKAGVTPPEVRIVSPKGGEAWNSRGTETIRWKATDEDGDELQYIVEYSRNNGKDWLLIGPRQSKSERTVDLGKLAGCEKSCRVRVIALDGINEGISQSATFSKAGQPPKVAIIRPRPVTNVRRNHSVTLKAAVSDREERLSDAQIRWYSARDGKLGSGQHVNIPQLSPGLHRIDVVARDSDGMKSIGTTAVYVHPTPVPIVHVNGKQGPVHLQRKVDAKIAIGLDAVGFPEKAEWWLVWRRPDGTQAYFRKGRWSAKPQSFYQGKAISTPPREIALLASDDLDSGLHTIRFGVDPIVDGKLDWENSFFESVTLSKNADRVK